MVGIGIGIFIGTILFLFLIVVFIDQIGTIKYPKDPKYWRIITKKTIDGEDKYIIQAFFTHSLFYKKRWRSPILRMYNYINTTATFSDFDSANDILQKYLESINTEINYRVALSYNNLKVEEDAQRNIIIVDG